MQKKCVKCKKLSENVVPIYLKGTVCGNENDYSGDVICEKCIHNSEEYDFCCFCDEEGVYLMNDLVSDGFNVYCKEHISETYLEEEEEDGWGTYIENINKF